MDSKDDGENWRPFAIFAACLLAAGDWPYDTYPYVRTAVCGLAIFFALYWWKRGKRAAAAPFGLILVMYNPLLPVGMSRTGHEIENLITAIIFITAIRYMPRQRASAPEQSASTG